MTRQHTRGGWLRLAGLAAAGLALCAPLGSIAQEAEETAPPPSEAPARDDPGYIPRWEGAPPLISTAYFTQRNPYAGARVSPDGKLLSMSLYLEDKSYILIRDIDSDKVIRTLQTPEDFDLNWTRWAGSDRLLVSLRGTDTIAGFVLPITRLFVYEISTKAFRYVGGNRMGLVGDDVIFTDPEGEYVVLSVARDLFSEPDVWRFRLDGSEPDRKVDLLERRKNDVWDWIADDAGVVRVGLGWSGNKLRVYYRKSPEDKLEVIARLGRNDDKEELWDVLRIISGSDEGLMLDEGPSGHVALYRFNYATREKGELIYENEDWDLTNLSIGKDGEPQAVYFTDDRDRVVWLDPEMAKVQSQLEKALGGRETWISSRAEDDSRMVVWTGSAQDPGVFYIFTPGKKELKLLAETRPGLNRNVLSPVEPITYTARDGTEIRAYLTTPLGKEKKDLPLVILPHGGPYDVRDKLDYSDEVQLLANRGYAALQPNFRGSGGYGEDFEKLGDGEIGRAMQDDIDDAMDWAVAQGIASPDRVCVVGSSYGGYAAMWAVIRNPERYRCAASFAGVTDFDAQLRFDADYFSSGKGKRAWKRRVKGEDKKFDMDLVSPAQQASRLTRPLLLAHGEKDNNVPFDQFKRMKRALDDSPETAELVEYLTWKNEGHGFFEAKNEQEWYDRLSAFLEKHNPPDEPNVIESAAEETAAADAD